MFNHREQPGSALKSVSTAGLKVERAKAPIFQFFTKILNAHLETFDVVFFSTR